MSGRRWQQKLEKFRALNGADKWMLIHATVWLALARLTLVWLPFKKVAANLPGEHKAEAGDPDSRLIERIGYAVRTAAANVPWRSDCFPQAIAGWMLLKHYRYNSTIHLGVERVGDKELAGHAWLTCRDTVVTGGEDLSRYTEMLPL